MDTVGKVVDAHERIGAWCAALACMVVGALVYVGPDTIPEELPQHRAIGLGFIGFGVVFVVALAARGKTGSRAKHFVLFLAAGAAAAGLGYATWREGRILQALEAEGEARDLKVLGTIVRHTAQNDAYFEVTLLDGPKRIRLKWDRAVKPGTTMTVLMHPDHPEWNAATHGGATLLEIADARGSRWTTLGMAFFSLILGLFALKSFWGAIVGSPAPDEEL